MKWLRGHTRRFWIARVLTLLMLAPYLTFGVPVPARAQSGLLSVYVLDFNNRSKIGGGLLGRVAAAQVSLQLTDSLTWEVVPDAQVQQRIQALNLQPPFDRVDRVRIANGVDASAVVYGSVEEARVSGGANPQAFVRLQVLVEDIQTGVLINGATAEGTSTRRMGFTGDADVLLEEALGKAAFKAREFMDRFRLPEGTVLNTTVIGGETDVQLDALLNIGARQGVRRGMEMVVTRLREPVGRLKITNVDSDVSTGRVLQNTQGVRPEDRVRAIFNFADFPVTRSRMRSAEPSAPTPVASLEPGQPAPKPGEAAAPVRVAKAAPGDLFIQLRGQDARSQTAVQNGQQAVLTDVVVDEPQVERAAGGGASGIRRFVGRNAFRMLVGGLLILGVLSIGGRAGTAATRPYEIEAYGYQQQLGAPGAFIRVCWSRPKSVLSGQVLQYVIWRADTQGDFRIVGAAQTDAIKCFVDSELTRTLTNVFDGQPGSDDAGGQTTIQNIPGITAGQQYRYQIATAYRNGLEDRDQDQMPDDEDFMSPLSMTSPWATAIRPPTISAPTNNQQVQLDQLEITWQQSPGANQYFIWVSRSPNFPASNRVQFGPITTLSVDQRGDLNITRTIDVRNRKLSGARTLYVTVGARNSQDAIKPKPFGAIYSAPVQIQPETAPPTPPGTGENNSTISLLNKKTRDAASKKQPAAAKQPAIGVFRKRTGDGK